MPQANPSGGANSERLENVTFPQARIDINDNLEALQTLNSGNSEPSTKAAFMQWLDTSSDPAVLKIRNSANTSWIDVGSLSATEYATKGLTAIANGGTGATTAATAAAALLPSQSGNSGKSLVTDGSVLSWLSIVASTHTRFDYTGSNDTWVKPTSGTFVIMFGWAGGGGGSRDSTYGGGGGGGGGCAFFLAPLSSLSSSTYTVTVGQGGAGATSNDSNGSSGGDTSVGSLFTVRGGNRGRANGFTSGLFAGDGGGFGGRGSEHLGGDAGTRRDVGPNDSVEWQTVAGSPATFGGGGGALWEGSAGLSIFGGGGGGTWRNDSNTTGGISINGGKGGDKNDDGVVPAGGGGGCKTGSAGSGAHGRVDIYVI